MNHPILRTLSVLLVLLAGPIARAAHFKLFLLTGQSNSLGTTNAGETDPTPGTDPADAHVRFFWSNRVDASIPLGDSGGVFTSLQDQQGGHYAGSATHWGPEINFGRTLYRAGVRNFGIIKASRGGGGNTFWLKNSANDHMYDHLVATVNAATTTLTANGDTFEIVGLLYLQGESDSAGEAALAGTRFKTLVDNLRMDLTNATNLFGMIGGIAASGATRDTVRTNHAAIGAGTAYIDCFSNLDLQSWTASDNLHFNKAAKLRIGERFAQAFFAAGIVTRKYGKLVFIGDSITQGGNGDYPGYRYTVFKHLANKSVPVNANTGYKFTGSVTGPQTTPMLTTPNVNGQVFENIHDGHFGWRTFWINGRVALPANRRNLNRGEGTILNWTGQASPQQYDLNTLGNKVAYPDPAASGTGNTGTTYFPDTVSIMIGINDLGDDNNSANQVRDDIATLIDQLRASNPNVRIHVNRLLSTNQTVAMKNAVDATNALLPALAVTKNAASSTSPVWIIDASTGFTPTTMTYDNVHPNAAGEAYVGDRIAAALGLIETPMATVTEPPHLESGSPAFPSRFEGHEIWNGTAFVNSWAQTGTPTKAITDLTDLKVVNTGTCWIEGTNSGWNTANNGNWTFETRLKFTANANGFIIWLGTDTQKVFVEIYGDRTQDNGNNTFNVSHNNLDGQFHTFRIAHDAGGAKYHVWRDGARLTPVAGVAYDGAGAESRLILGDYTSGTFGNNFDATIDYVRYDQTGAYLPAGADADADGLPDSWEYHFFGNVTSGIAGDDDDGDGKTNRQEYISNTDPKNAASAFKVNSISMPATNQVQVSLGYSSPQRNYALQKSIDLGTTDPWLDIAGPTIGTDATLTLTDSNASGARAFYRVSVTIP